MRAAMRKREAVEPRKLYRVEADVVAPTAGSNVQPIAQEWTGSIGVRGRGEYTKVIHAYLGGLTGPAKER